MVNRLLVKAFRAKSHPLTGGGISRLLFTLLKQNDRRYLPAIVSLFEDTRMTMPIKEERMNDDDFGIAINRKLAGRNTKLCDYALATALMMTGQPLEDYGFDIIREATRGDLYAFNERGTSYGGEAGKEKRPGGVLAHRRIPESRVKEVGRLGGQATDDPGEAVTVGAGSCRSHHLTCITLRSSLPTLRVVKRRRVRRVRKVRCPSIAPVGGYTR